MMSRFHCHDARRDNGFTLIELIIFIVIVGIALSGVLLVFRQTAQSSADPMIRKQALTVAEMMLTQVLSKSYQNYCELSTVPVGAGVTPCVGASDATNASATFGCTPTTATLCRTNNPTDLPNYNDVSDYANWNQGSVYRQDGTINGALGLPYSVSVAVTATTIGPNATPAKRVAVTVTGGLEPITLIGYRTPYE